MCRVLIIPDLHGVAIHPEALDFVKGVRKYYRTNTTIFIGDIGDQATWSLHPKNNTTQGADDEDNATIVILQPWYKAFPTAKVCIGNHDIRITKRASEDAMLPGRMMPTMRTVYKAPKHWVFADKWIIDDVLYKHGDPGSGKNIHVSALAKEHRSVVVGHAHSVAGIYTEATTVERLFAMVVGCLCDPNHPAMKYGSRFTARPVLGCGVVIEGKYPIWIPLELGKKVKRG